MDRRRALLVFGAAVPADAIIAGSAASQGLRADWLRCYSDGGVNWLGWRSTLSIYADKYLESPARLAKEAQQALVYAQQPFPDPATAPCPLGDLAVRLFMWLFFDERSYLGALEQLVRYGDPSHPFDPRQPAAMLADTLHALWHAPLSWADILDSGWPIFSILGKLNDKARSGPGFDTLVAAAPGQCEGTTVWGGPSYLDALQATFVTGALVPVHASISALLATEREQCPIAFASILLALADSVRWDAIDQEVASDGGRNAFYYRYAALSPEAALKNLQMNIGTAYQNDQKALVAHAERVLRGVTDSAAEVYGAADKASRWPVATLLSRWPLWRLLDRLSCSDWALVRTYPTSPRAATRLLRSALPSFWLHIYPHRGGSDGLQSSRTRASRRPYCAKEFQNEFDMLRLRYGDGPLRFVEVGAHLGDCLLWSAARVGCSSGLRATGFEVIRQVVALTRKSVERNGFQSCLEPRLGFLTEAPGEIPSHPGVPGRALDVEVQEHVHILKVHTNGNEDLILRGGRTLFSDPRLGVDVVVLNSANADLLGRVVAFLSSVGGPGYTLEIRGVLLRGSVQEITETIRAMMADGSGSVQLIARRTDLPPPAARPINRTVMR